MKVKFIKITAILLTFSVFFMNIELVKAESLADKLKDSIKSIGGKIQDAVSISKKDDKTVKIVEEKKQEDDPERKSKTIVRKYIIHVPPPDAKIFKEKPLDIALKRPTSYLDGGRYMVENIFVFENSGDVVGESMEIATRTALDLAFSNLILDLDLQHMYFTMQDAMSCLLDIYTTGDHFYQNEYLGNYTVIFDEKKLQTLIALKKYKLFQNGLDEYSNPFKDISVKAHFIGKYHLAELEERLIASGLKYVVKAMSHDFAIISICSNEQNIVKILEENGLGIDIKNDGYYLLLNNEDGTYEN